MFNTFTRDECCSQGLAEFLIEHEDAVDWACPECNLVWRPTLYGTEIRHWDAESWSEVIA